MVNILTIDTSFNLCSIGLLQNNHFNTLCKNTKNNHAKFILSMINKILLENNFKLNNLNFIAVNIGPGNFTSLRIGINVSQGLSLALNIPIITMSSLFIIADRVFRKYKKKKILILIDAKMNKFYFASYILNKKNRLCLLNNEIIVSYEEIFKMINLYDNSWSIAGNGWNIFFKKLDYYNLKIKNVFKKVNIYLPSSNSMIYISIDLLKTGEILLPEHIIPNYLYSNIIFIK